MSSIDYFQVAYTAAGGLGLFFIGLRYLSEGLQSLAGDIIRSMINFATSNRVMAVIVGLGITTLIQSSSISTVMVVGLVDAGLMSLTQAIGVILGANIGTTITGWILVVKIGKYGLLLIGLGFFPMLFSKKPRLAASGRAVLALGLIFYGLQLMSGAFKPLRTDESFISFLHLFDTASMFGLLGCIAMGCLLTFVIQSSSAMLGITIALASTGTIDFPTAAALVLGENIGTTITAMLAALGTSIPARRAALSHAIFNLLGVSVMIIIFQPYLQLVDSIVPGVPDALAEDGSKPFIAAHIAMGHTLFNVTATLLMLPFLNYFANFIMRVIPDKSEKETHRLRYLGAPGQVTTAVALNTASMELRHMSEIAAEVFEKSRAYLEALEHDPAQYEKVCKLEAISDNMQEEITNYVCNLMSQRFNAEQASEAYTLIRAADEIESVIDYCQSICQYRKRMFENNLTFSETGWADIFDFFDKVKDLFTLVSKLTAGEDLNLADKVSTSSRALTEHADHLRNLHLDRMREGTCQAMPALAFSDIMVAMRRIKNHSVNLYEALDRADTPNDHYSAA